MNIFERIIWFWRSRHWLPPTVVCLGAATTVQAASLPRLWTEGSQIIQVGRGPIRLRGVNVADPEHIATKRPGATIESVITAAAKHMNANVVRLPILPEHDVDGGTGFFRDGERYWDRFVRPAIKVTEKLGVYLIIEPHFIGDYREQGPALWAFWRQVLPRLGGHDHVLVDLMNEPTTPDSWPVWYEEVVVPLVRLVREHDPRRLILVSGTNYATNFTGVLKTGLPDKGVVLSAHLYPKLWTRELQRELGAIATHLPLVISEWGFGEHLDAALRGTASKFGEPFLQWMDERQLSWLAWVYDSQWGQMLVDQSWQPRRGDGFMADLLMPHLAPEPEPTIAKTHRYTQSAEFAGPRER